MNQGSRTCHAGAEANGEPTHEITATLRRHVDPSARRVRITSTAIQPGMSGVTILRHRVEFDTDRERRRTLSLVSKQTTLVERRVLALLQDQGQTWVPFNYSPNLVDDVRDITCMEDLGCEHRPTSLDPIPAHLIAAEARSLALLHHLNVGHSDDLAWLPHVDRSYVVDHMRQFWAPAWTRAVETKSFRREFGDRIATVEAAAASVADEVAQLATRPDNLTLIHGDMNPSNVLITSGAPRLIDWQAACLGPYYLDLPHHLFTLEMAEEYRRGREELGDTIQSVDFAAGYRVASHYIGLRYIWWTLDLWQEDPTQSQWVRFYLDLIAR